MNVMKTYKKLLAMDKDKVQRISDRCPKAARMALLANIKRGRNYGGEQAFKLGIICYWVINDITPKSGITLHQAKKANRLLWNAVKGT